MNEFLKTKKISHLLAKTCLCMLVGMVASLAVFYSYMLVSLELSTESLVVTILVLSTMYIAFRNTMGMVFKPVPARSRR